MTARFVFLILDGVGVGALPDAADYGDAGSNTLGNLAALIDLELPNLGSLGLGNILPLRTVPPAARPLALPGRLAERSQGKDTTAGHWEHMGVITETPFRTYPSGFPPEVLRPFEERIGRTSLGNKAASGTEIIAELGEEHLRTGRPIVYTSADSVFQIAAHVEVVPLEQLYDWCRTARELLVGPHAVGRVIARPFEGTAGAFVRTKDRKDFSLEPPALTYLDLLCRRGVPTVGVGKIYQIYAGRGVAEEHKVASNDENLQKLMGLLEERRDGLIMTNLVDFDMSWGHRNDLEGFAAGLEAVDRALPRMLDLLGPEDRLLITADHGVDPTTVSTDHSREYVPLLYYPRPQGAPAAGYEGYMSDTGASMFSHLTGERAALTGQPIEELRPARGWRHYPPVMPGDSGVPCAVGAHEAAEAAAMLTSRLGPAPSAAVVLGSGLDLFVDTLVVQAELPYADIPHWHAASVAGHRGSLAVGVLQGRRLAVLRGRAHGYEGLDRSELQLPVRTLARWGVRVLVLTNASGGLRPGLEPGSLLLVERLLDMQEPAAGGAPAVVDCGSHRAKGVLPGLPRVVYAALPGPQYETAAEVKVLRGLGADAVGMSTAAETDAARQEGLELVVLSVLTNPAGAGLSDGGAVHEEVLDVGRAAAPRVAATLQRLFLEYEF